MEIVAVSNQKGGVGKSTTAVHLAMALHEKGKRVVFIDLDPQANATKTLTVAGSTIGLAASSLFGLESFSLASGDSITLIEADSLMADMERADPAVLANFKKQVATLASDFDFCIIDTPPTLGLRMTAALIVANYVLSPIELEEYSIDGIEKMLKTVFGIKNKWNPDLNFLGMLPNRFNPRSEAQRATLKQLLSKYAHLLIAAKIGIRSSIPEALSEGKPVWHLKKTAAREAAKEFQEAFAIIFEKMGVVE